jgi:hypothetical protein
VLADGITLSNTVKTETASAGVSWASVRRTGDSLGVIRSMRTGNFSYWNLPKMSNQDAQRLTVEQVETEIQSEAEYSAWQCLKVTPASFMTPELRDLIHPAKDVLNDLLARMALFINRAPRPNHESGSACRCR